MLWVEWVQEKGTEQKEKQKWQPEKVHERKNKQMKGTIIKNISYWFFYSSSSEPPNSKRPKTSPVVVEQTGDSEKVVIDQIADNDAIFEEV